MATPGGKKPNKQQINDAGNEVGLDLANAIGKAVSQALSSYDFSPLAKNITKTVSSEVSKINPIELQAKVLSVDTSAVATEYSKLKPAELQALIMEVDTSLISTEFSKLKIADLQALVTEVDTSLIGDEINKLNPLALQAKLTEVDSSVIEKMPQASITGGIQIDPANVQSQLDNLPSAELKATIGKVQQPREDLFGPVEVNPKIGQIDFDADRFITVFDKSLRRLEVGISTIASVLRKEISSSPFDQMADGIEEVSTKSNKTGSDFKRIGDQLTKLTTLLTKAFDAGVINEAGASVNKMHRDIVFLGEGFEEVNTNAENLLSSVKESGQSLIVAGKEGATWVQTYVSLKDLSKENLKQVADTLKIQNAQQLSTEELKGAIADQLVLLDRKKALNEEVLRSYQDQEETLGEVIRSTNSLVQNLADSKNVSQMLVADASMYANLIGQSGTITAETAQLYSQLAKASKEELVIAAQKLGVTNAETLSKNKLAGLIANNTLKLAEQKKVVDDTVSSYDDMDKAMKQVIADNKLKTVMIKTGLTGEYAETARLLELQKEQGLMGESDYATALKRLKAEHHIYEERVKQLEITESLAAWQLEMREELEDYEKGWEKIKSKIKAVITDPKLAKTVFAAEGIKTAIESVKKFGEGFEKMKEKGLSAGQAATAQMKTISTMSVLGLSDTQGVMEQVIESYGNVNALSRTQVDNIGQMAHHMGITGQEAMQVNATLSQMTGETTESAIEAMHFTENLAKASGVAPGKVMKDIAKNSAAVALYSKDGAKGFGKAAIELHKMGVEIGTAAKMADGLLDFENSINKQMEASVLLGREINLDKAREMALNGDLAGAAKETLANIGGAAEFTKMNVIQKRALAEAAGMTVEELQKALDAEEEQQKYHGEEAGFWMNTIGYVTEYGTKLGGFLKEHGVLLASGLNLLANGNAMEMIKTGLQKAGNVLSSVGNGLAMVGNLIARAGLGIVRMIFGEKAAGYIKDKAQWALEKAHYAWLKTQAFFGSDKAKGKLADMAKDKLAGGVTDKAKDMATDKAKDLAGDKVKDLAGDKAGDLADKAADKGTEKLTGVAEDKAGDLAGKATEGADKLGESGEKVGKKGMTEGFKDNMTNIAEGFKQMGQAGVFKGVFNTALAGPALVVALPAIPFLLFMGKVALNQLATNFTNLASGLTAMSGTFAGSAALGVFAIASIPSIAAIPFLLFMGLTPLAQLATNFTNLATGLTAMSGTFAGSAALAVFGLAAIPSVLSIPFLLFMGLTPLAQLATNFTNLAAGLTAMSGTFAGAAALAVFGIAAIPAVASIPFLLFMGLTPLKQLTANFTTLAAGLTAMSGTFAGSGALAVFGLAAIPAVASIPFLAFMGVFPLKQLASNFANLAIGLTLMGSATAGAVTLGVFALSALAAVGSIPFLTFMGLIPLSQLATNFTSLSAGLIALNSAVVGAAALGVFAISATAAIGSIPFLTFMGFVSLSQLLPNFTALSSGLMAMSATILGSAALLLFAVAGAAAIPSLVFLGGISLLGAPAAAGLIALAGGLAAFGNPATALFVLTGIGLLAALGVAMIPFAAALAIATPAIKVFGDIIIGVFQQIPPIIAAVAAGFVTIFGALAANWQILIPVGIGLGAVAIGLGALGGAALLAFPGLLLASIGLSMMQAPLAMINAVAQTDAIPKLAQSFTMLAALGPGLLVFSISLGALGAAGMLAFPGLVLAGAGLLAMAPGLMAVGAIAQTGAITTLSQSLTGLGSAAGGLALVSASLFGIAGGLGAIAIAGFAAMPIIGALAGLATVAPMLAGLGSLFGGGGGGGEQQTTTQTNTTAAPTEDGKMDILISEIRSLKDIMSKGGVINMDGKKVGDVVRLAMNTSGVR